MRFPHFSRSVWIVSCLVATLVCSSAAFAQASQAPRERLFLAFDREATLVDRQWWEGSVEFVDWDPVEALGVRATIAFQPWEDIEIGGRVGFASTDAPAPIQDGSGATDLDLWGKWWFGQAGNDTSFVLGGVLTIPTGDDSAGLGFDAFSVAPFVSVKHRIERATLHGNVGVRFGDDGRVFGIDLDSETSPFLGVGASVPFNETVSFIGELQFEGERFEGIDSDVRLLGGVNWIGLGSGVFRSSIAFGLDDGAPDFAVQAGYAVQF